MDGMEQTVMTLIASAVGFSFIISGITEVVKQNSKLSGIWVIVFAIVTGVLLLVAVALVFGYSLPIAGLTGVLSGLASVGAFNGINKVINK